MVRDHHLFCWWLCPRLILLQIRDEAGFCADWQRGHMYAKTRFGDTFSLCVAASAQAQHWSSPWCHPSARVQTGSALSTGLRIHRADAAKGSGHLVRSVDWRCSDRELRIKAYILIAWNLQAALLLSTQTS